MSGLPLVCVFVLFLSRRIQFSCGKPLIKMQEKCIFKKCIFKMQDNSARLRSPAFLLGLLVAPGTRLSPAGQLPSPSACTAAPWPRAVLRPPGGDGKEGQWALPVDPLTSVPSTTQQSGEAYAPRLRMMVFLNI